MRYLQADIVTKNLSVLPEQIDWSTFKTQPHYDYAVATLQLFGGQPFCVTVNASKVSWAAILNIGYFVKIAKYARQIHKNQLIKVEIINASKPTRILFAALQPFTPDAVYKKIAFVTLENCTKKKT